MLSSSTGSISYLSAIETHKSHERLRVEYNGMNMPIKCQTSHYAHQIDENNSGEFYVAFTLGDIGIKFFEQSHKAKLLQKVEKFVEQSCFTKAIDLGDIFALSEVFGNTCLVSVCGAPGQTVSDFL